MLTARCAHVTENPENIRTNVLNSGNSQTGIVCTPTGGNIDPVSLVGHKAAWKNAQKNPKNNINSDAINNKNPKRNPKRTGFVWYPDSVASSTTSLSHWKTQILTHTNPQIITYPPYFTPCIKKAKPDAKKNAENATNIGQGLRATKWKRCAFLFIK